MSREHEQKPSDRDPNTQTTTSEPTVDTGPNQQAGQMMGLDPDVQVQNHATGGGNAQIGQMEGLLEGTSLDVRPRKHRALINGVPVKPKTELELDATTSASRSWSPSTPSVATGPGSASRCTS